MTASNHALVGSAIALTVKQPLLALPLAFASHFVLDALPHFGYPGLGEAFKHKLFIIVESFDAIVLILIFLTMVQIGYMPLLGALMAISPDFEWVYRYFFYERKGLKPPLTSPLAKFHSKIQRYERPWGIAVELPFFLIVFVLIYTYLI